MRVVPISFFFFFNDTATTEIYTLSLHDALPICGSELRRSGTGSREAVLLARESLGPGWKTVSSKQRKLVGNRTSGSEGDRKSTRLNSSHGYISYAVFCLKKKKLKQNCSSAVDHC